MAYPATRSRPALRDLAAVWRAAHAEPGDILRLVLGDGALTHAIKPRFYKLAVADIDHCVREPPAEQHGLDMRWCSRHLHKAVIAWQRFKGRLRFIDC